MSFRISVSPQRKRSNTGMSQTARTQRKSIHSSLNAIIEEIKSQMKQLNPEFQNLLLQLFRIAFELEKQNIKYQNVQQSSKANSIHQIDSFQKEPSQHQERNRSKDISPNKRDSTSRCAEMTSSTKLDPTPKQKFLIRRNTFEIDHQVSKDQLRKISQEAIDFNFIFNLLDFKTCNLKSMNYKKFNQIFTLNEQDLYQYIQKTDYQEYLLYLYEPIKFIRELSTKSIQYIEKLKKIIKLQFEISKCSPSQIFEQYQTLLQQTFECDRNQILLYDQKANQFWTKSNQATQKICYQFKGIPAFVKNKGQLLNLTDVYQDVRFDQEYDLKQGVKTKTMLACPIENQGEIIGVIMISSSTYQYKKDDELLMQIIAQSCTLHFSQFINQEFNSKTCESLQQILKYSLLLQQSIDQKQFMILAQEILLKSYQLKQVQIFFKDMQDVESLFTYVNQQRKKVPKSCGIIGYVYKTGQLYICDSCYKDRYFNKLGDIETNLPTITLPVKDEDKCMGVIQYIDTKGIDNLVGKNIKNNQLSNIDLLLTFANMLNYVNNKLIIQK